MKISKFSCISMGTRVGFGNGAFLRRVGLTNVPLGRLAVNPIHQQPRCVGHHYHQQSLVHQFMVGLRQGRINKAPKRAHLPSFVDLISIVCRDWTVLKWDYAEIEFEELNIYSLSPCGIFRTTDNGDQASWGGRLFGRLDDNPCQAQSKLKMENTHFEERNSTLITPELFVGQIRLMLTIPLNRPNFRQRPSMWARYPPI